MGSQHSSTNSINKKVSNQKTKKSNQDISQENQSQIYFNDSSSYKGVKTDTTSLNGNSLSGNSSISDKNNENKYISEQINNIKIPTLFQWKEGGNNILITGSFCGWSHRFTMTKNKKNNFYELTLYLPKGEYQFKFIIDNIWKCSNFYPTVTDLNNNTNNVLDNTKELNLIIKEREKEKEKERENQNTANSSINDNNINNENNKTNYKNASIFLSDEIRKIYGNLYPLKEQLNSDPPNLPQYYINSFDFNNYPIVGEKKYVYNKMKNNLIRETFQSIKIPNHVYLNHIFSNCKKDKYFNRNCVSFRIRSKFGTIIYIHPNQED